MKGKNDQEEREDFAVDIEAEDVGERQNEQSLMEEEEMGAGALKKLREKLKMCEAEKAAHLNGWQRANADLANYKREVRESGERNRERAAEKILTDIVPTLDAFMLARESKEWGAISESWRKGVERIHDGLLSSLAVHGLSSFGAVGEAFDPERFEAVGMDETDEKEKDHTVSVVLQKGYALHGHPIRVAKVRVFEYV